MLKIPLPTLSNSLRIVSLYHSPLGFTSATNGFAEVKNPSEYPILGSTSTGACISSLARTPRAILPLRATRYAPRDGCQGKDGGRCRSRSDHARCRRARRMLNGRRAGREVKVRFVANNSHTSSKRSPFRLYRSAVACKPAPHCQLRAGDPFFFLYTSLYAKSWVLHSPGWHDRQCSAESVKAELILSSKSLDCAITTVSAHRVRYLINVDPSSMTGWPNVGVPFPPPPTSPVKEKSLKSHPSRFLGPDTASPPFENHTELREAPRLPDAAAVLAAPQFDLPDGIRKLGFQQ